MLDQQSYRGVLQLSLLGAVVVGGACSHATLKPSIALVGADGSWAGYVQGCELRMRTKETTLRLTDPQVLVSGRTILLNSETRDAKFSTVHINTEQVACVISGVAHEQTVSGCLGRGTWSASTCIVSLNGCGDRMDGKALARFARRNALPRPGAVVKSPLNDVDSCRPGWRKAAGITDDGQPLAKGAAG